MKNKIKEILLDYNLIFGCDCDTCEYKENKPIEKIVELIYQEALIYDREMRGGTGRFALSDLKQMLLPKEPNTTFKS